MLSGLSKELLSSDASAQILEFFFLNPRERLYQRELGTRLAFAPLRLFMPLLVQAGLLSQEEEGKVNGKKKIYYRANLDSPVFVELRKLFVEYKQRIPRNGNGHGHPWQAPASGQTWSPGGDPARVSGNGSEEPDSDGHGPGQGKDPAEPVDSIDIPGTGRAIEEVRRSVTALAPSEVVVCIRGESGTGKERVARAIHQASARSSQPFFALDCSTFSESSLDALLFGRLGGAPASRSPGLLGWPAGGSVYLRQIESLGITLQRKLLRSIEERQYSPQDGLSPLPVRVRLICGSTEALAAKVAEGKFSYDLHAKLALYEIWMPPLRERSGDIPLLARHLIERWCRAAGRDVPVLGPEAMKALQSRPWQGNVRELSDVLERTLLLLEGSSIGLSDLPTWPSPVPSGDRENLREARREFERQHVARILDKYSNDKVQAAKALKVNVSTVYRWSKEA
jgi:DNA-binding NtrC family response regulator